MNLPLFWHVADFSQERWEAIYQGLDVKTELYKMHEWLEANPHRRPRNYKRFIVRWLNRAHGNMERAVAAEQMRQEIRRGNANFR